MMNKTVVFVAVCSMVVVGIVAASVIALWKPEGFLTFTGFIGSTLIAVTGFAASLYSLSKVTDRIEAVDKRTERVEHQTNGRLTARDRENAQLRAALIREGHGDIAALIETTNTH